MILPRSDKPARPVTAPVAPVRSDAPAPDAERDAAGAAPASAPADRVEISAAGRAQASAASAGADLATARVALRAGADLEPARVEALRADVREGKYDQPEVIGRVAEAAARDLAP